VTTPTGLFIPDDREMSADDAITTATKLLLIRADEQPRLRHIANYLRNETSSVYVPRGARQEYRWLIQRAKLNILPLVVTAVAQGLYVDGYRPIKSDKDAASWATWQANKMDARQHGLHRAVLKYGVAYVLVMPGKPAPVITPKSPRRMTAFYSDPIDDEWPMYAIEEVVENVAPGKRRRVISLIDDYARYTLIAKLPGKGRLSLDSVEVHDLGVCPVVRYLNGDDLDGDENIRGEVEPLIEMQDQINVTTFNLLMSQSYSAHRQRWATGMSVPLDEKGVPIEPFNSAVNRLFVAEDPETKFGEFGATPLDPYINSREATIRHMASVSQTPPYYLLGSMVNMSAEALAAAESGLQRKIAERKSSFGESHEQTLRLTAHASGDSTGWADTSSQVVWRDTEARSLAATADALGKLAMMLDVPPQELWQMIPGVTQQDVVRWKDAAKKLAAQLAAQQPQPGAAGQQPGTGPGANPAIPAPTPVNNMVAGQSAPVPKTTANANGAAK